jgi:hypothetical protein
MILKPVKNVLALDLAIKTKLGGDVLDLISTWGSKPRPEQVG